MKSMLEAVEQLPHLKLLGIDGFKGEHQLEEYFFEMTPFLRLQSLKELVLVGCPEIRSLREQLGLLTRITSLSIWLFNDLEEISEWLCNLSSLESLQFWCCYSLSCLPSKESLLRLTQLRRLLISECPLLEESYVKVSRTRALNGTRLNISTTLKSLVKKFSKPFSSRCLFAITGESWVANLSISDAYTGRLDANAVLRMLLCLFPRLTTWMLPSVEVAVVFPCLGHLQVEDCPVLKTIPALHCESSRIDGFKDEQQLEEYFSDMTPFLRLQSLKELLLVGCPEIRSLPEQLGLLTRITRLRIGLFEDLEEIPEWLCNLSSLELLDFRSCMSLKCLPSKESLLRLTRLRKLVIFDCPLLKECILKGNCPEWLKVKHLHYIEIDDSEVF
ncbi:uncharacterized protein LOC141627657 [Silene latifolia]|uniref:uncharacterized protein LOC141627657 n=1 Tax=Silene latifolia TaxID=37657 RepID=UPI003D78A668